MYIFYKNVQNKKKPEYVKTMQTLINFKILVYV